MNPAIGAAAVAGGSSILGDVTSAYMARSEAKRTMQRQKRYTMDLMDKQNKDQRKMNRVYHSDYVYSLRQAGLNPMLAVMGSSGSSAASGSASAVASQPKIDGGKAVSNALQAKLLSAQIDNVNANTDKVRAETGGKASKGILGAEAAELIKNSINSARSNIQKYEDWTKKNRETQSNHIKVIKSRFAK